MLSKLFLKENYNKNNEKLVFMTENHRGYIHTVFDVGMK